MSESSTEKATEPVAPEAKQSEAKVPVAAVAKERAEKRAARAEADDLRQKLAEVQEQSQQNQSPIDMKALLDTLGQFVIEQSEAAAAKAIAPVKAEAEKFKTAAALGLNPAQADELARVKEKWQGMDDAKALVLARMEKPELFPAPARPSSGRGPVTGLPPGGDSMERTGPSQDDFVAKMNAATDPSEKQKFATMELFRRFDAARKSRG